MRLRFRGLGRALLALWLVVLMAGGPLAETLDESLAELQKSAREYQESLARLLALREQDAVRAEASAERYRALLPQGLVSRRDVETAEAAAAQARVRVEETRNQIAEAEQVVVEARARAELAALPPLAIGEERATPDVLEYRGASRWTLAEVANLERFFAQRFGRALPISALGQTPLHDRLRLDHRNALDVAVNPDSPEGWALLEYLRSRGVPFLAFRGAIAGVSTGAHVHVGLPSPRKI